MAVRNYFARYMDMRTLIEVALFLAVLLVYLFIRVFKDIAHAHRQGNIDTLLVHYMFFIWLIHFFSGITFTRKNLTDPAISVLLERPLSLPVVAVNKIIELLLPVLLYIPFWLVVFFMFLAKSHTPLVDYVFGSLVQLVYMLTATLAGMTLAIGLSEGPRCRHKTIRYAGLIMLFIVLAAVWRCFLLNMADFLSVAGVTGHVIAGIGFFVFLYKSLVVQLTYDPEKFINFVRRKQWWGRMNVNFLLLPVPSGQRTIVRKDLIYAMRSFKVYYLLLLLFFIFAVYRMNGSENIKDAAQWLFSLTLFAGFIFANIGFRFSQNVAENLRIIKSLPVAAARLWWSKFWTSFLPGLWILLPGSLFLFLKFGFSVTIFLYLIAPALLIHFTLIYLQNNFALYSYPYSKYAIFWYNFYIVVAVLFFTVLLFPPLAVFFLIFGYTAIFRVLNRIKNVEVFQ